MGSLQGNQEAIVILHNLQWIHSDHRTVDTVALGNQQQWIWQRKIYILHFCAIGIFRNLWQAPPATSWQIMEHLPPPAPHKPSHGQYVLFLTICQWLNLKTVWHCFNLPFTLHRGVTSPAMVEVLSIYSRKWKFQYPSELLCESFWSSGATLSLRVLVCYISELLLEFNFSDIRLYLLDDLCDLNLVTQFRKNKGSKSIFFKKSPSFPLKKRIIFNV